MPELLRVCTPDFEFSVWCSDITKRQNVHQATLTSRGLCGTAEQEQAQEVAEYASVVRFSPPLLITQLAVNEQVQGANNGNTVAQLPLAIPIFYENIQYQFEWVFFGNVGQARLIHRSQIVNNGFRFAPRRGGIPARLTGTINTGNDVGWMRLPLEYELNGKTIKSLTSFEVLPTKMLLHQDLPAMYRAIDQTFPLWRFSLVEKTEQDAAKGMQRGHFPLMWLANFGQLRERLEKGLKIIAQAPHSRLQTHVAYTKAACLKGGVSYKLGLRVKEDLANGQGDKRYRVEKKQLCVDTPENRFIKMVVVQSKKKLADFEHRLRISNQAPDKQRLSEAFLNEIHSWQHPLQKMLEQSFLKDVGAFSGLKSESLVLQQKTGYSAVYLVWQELKFYLDVFANQSSISMKSVAEIYEIWCFLSLKQMLHTELGFEEIPNSKANLVLNEFFEYQLKDGFAGAFEFTRADGVTARLAHEPKFTKQGKTIRSYLANQEPDIVLEVTLPTAGTGQVPKHFIWLFDAKYRIKTDNNRFDSENIDAIDYVPDDAINQMHRYRDALIRLTQEDSQVQKSRPVFGAFALYPGYFDQEKESNPYAQAIAEVGIGAFALLPSKNEEESGHVWLLRFLKEQIGDNPKTKSYSTVNTMAEQLYVQDAARIPYGGMQQVLYPDLTMTIALAGKSGRQIDYFNGFENGTAQWYHLPQKTFVTKFKQHITHEIRYLALASTSKKDSSSKQIDKIWPVKRVLSLPRSAINVQQAGKASGSSELFYLFELGRPLTLQKPVTHVPHYPIKNSMKLTTLNKLESVQLFSGLESVYHEGLV